MASTTDPPPGGILPVDLVAESYANAGTTKQCTLCVRCLEEKDYKHRRNNAQKCSVTCKLCNKTTHKGKTCPLLRSYPTVFTLEYLAKHWPEALIDDSPPEQSQHEASHGFSRQDNRRGNQNPNPRGRGYQGSRPRNNRGGFQQYPAYHPDPSMQGFGFHGTYQHGYGQPFNAPFIPPDNGYRGRPRGESQFPHEDRGRAQFRDRDDRSKSPVRTSRQGRERTPPKHSGASTKVHLAHMAAKMARLQSSGQEQTGPAHTGSSHDRGDRSMQVDAPSAEQVANLQRMVIEKNNLIAKRDNHIAAQNTQLEQLRQQLRDQKVEQNKKIDEQEAIILKLHKEMSVWKKGAPAQAAPVDTTIVAEPVAQDGPQSKAAAIRLPM